MTRIRPYLLTCCCTALLLLASGRAMQLRADTPGAESAAQEATCAALGGPLAAVPGEKAPSAGKQTAQPGRAQSLRAQHLAPRDRPQHTLFANAAYTAVISTLYLAESSSGSLNEGYDISAGYNWTSRRGFGAGIVYSGGFISAERNGIRRTSRIHYIAPEFVARSGPGADGSSGKARASATAATSAATAIRRAAGAASASMNRPPWSSCWDATSAWRGDQRAMG